MGVKHQNITHSRRSECDEKPQPKETRYLAVFNIAERYKKLLFTHSPTTKICPFCQVLHLSSEEQKKPRWGLGTDD